MAQPQPSSSPSLSQVLVKFNPKILQITTRPPNKFLDLPTELHLNILESLLGHSQVCLGLTCKSMARLFNFGNVNARLLSYGLFSTTEWTRYILPYALAKLKDWMPTTHQFCDICKTYKLKQSSASPFPWMMDGSARLGGFRRGKPRSTLCSECVDILTDRFVPSQVRSTTAMDMIIWGDEWNLIETLRRRREERRARARANWEAMQRSLCTR